jgi:CobQ-like glutamine amidotransferase family enzyme
MGVNIDVNTDIAQGAPYIIICFLFQILLQFIVLAFGVHVIGLSCLSAIFHLLC